MRRSGRETLRRIRQELALPLGGRLALFAGADLALLGAALFSALLAGGEVPTLYGLLVLLPTLTLGVLAMADVVAVERRSGCLDLVLALPASWRYFERRMMVVGGAMLLQDFLVVLLLWISASFAFPVVPALLHAAAVTVFVAAASLFWAVRLGSPGAVAAATLGSAALLAGRWVADPPLAGPEEAAGALTGSAENLLRALGGSGALLVLAALLLAFARRRLARAETLFS